jgi:thiol-disulfide isomerase/thioredoxin
VTIIFDSLKENYDTLRFANGAEMIIQTPVLSFRSKNKTDHIPFLSKPEQDTVSYKIEGDYIVVSYRYNPISKLDFIAKRGDTIIIDEKNVTPYIRINREKKGYEGNYDYYKKARYGSLTDFSIEDSLNHSQALYFLGRGIPWKDGVKKTTDKYKEILIDEREWIDSLYKSLMISDIEYLFFKERNKYSLLNMELKTNMKNKDSLLNILRAYNDSLYINDDFGFYTVYYQNILNTYLTFSQEQVSSKSAYDNLNESKLNIGKLGLTTKYRLLENIINTNSIETAKKYYDMFIQNVSDTTISNYLNKKYSYLFDDETTHSNDIELLDTDNKRISLSEILKYNKGNFIYIDFWASWCAPCLKEMPSAKSIREKYKDENIVFIYLSIFDEKENWKQSIKKAQLQNVKNNYLILNPYDAILIKNLNIKSIPRYLLYDKNGELIYRNAPEPSSLELQQIFNQLIESVK